MGHGKRDSRDGEGGPCARCGVPHRERCSALVVAVNRQSERGVAGHTVVTIFDLLAEASRMDEGDDRAGRSDRGHQTATRDERDLGSRLSGCTGNDRGERREEHEGGLGIPRTRYLHGSTSAGNSRGVALERLSRVQRFAPQWTREATHERCPSEPDGDVQPRSRRERKHAWHVREVHCRRALEDDAASTRSVDTAPRGIRDEYRADRLAMPGMFHGALQKAGIDALQEVATHTSVLRPGGRVEGPVHRSEDPTPGYGIGASVADPDYKYRTSGGDVQHEAVEPHEESVTHEFRPAGRHHVPVVEPLLAQVIGDQLAVVLAAFRAREARRVLVFLRSDDDEVRGGRCRVHRQSGDGSRLLREGRVGVDDEARKGQEEGDERQARPVRVQWCSRQKVK